MIEIFEIIKDVWEESMCQLLGHKFKDVSIDATQAPCTRCDVIVPVTYDCYSAKIIEYKEGEDV